MLQCSGRMVANPDYTRFGVTSGRAVSRQRLKSWLNEPGHGPPNHDASGLNECKCGFAGLEVEIANFVGSDDGGHFLDAQFSVRSRPRRSEESFRRAGFDSRHPGHLTGNTATG